MRMCEVNMLKDMVMLREDTIYCILVVAISCCLTKTQSQLFALPVLISILLIYSMLIGLIHLLPRDATYSAVMPQYVVCPSVTFRYRDHIGWNTWKIILRPNSLRLTQHGPSGATITPPKLGWYRGGVTRKHKKSAVSPKRCKIGPRLLP